jgi:hypothetical protein
MDDRSVWFVVADARGFWWLAVSALMMMILRQLQHGRQDNYATKHPVGMCCVSNIQHHTKHNMIGISSMESRFL